jgi:hypothetical protein
MKARRAAPEAGQENPALQAVQQEVHHQAQTAQQQKIALQIPQTARLWFISESLDIIFYMFQKFTSTATII